MKTFAIVGAGAVGSYYGGRLAAAGYEVSFLLRSDFEDVMENGLMVESVAGDFYLPEVKGAKSSEEIGIVDVVIVAWKSTANEAYEKVLRPLVGEGTIILTLQNGLGNVEKLQDIFGRSLILGGLCFVCINRMRAGVISHTSGGKMAIGVASLGVGDLGGRVLELVTIFKKTKIPAFVVENLGEAQWRKLVWNVPFNGLSIVEGGIDTKTLLARPGMENKVRAIMVEVIAAAAALGFQIEEEFIDEQVALTRVMSAYRPSSMIDFVEGRAVETEAIWAEPLRRAERAGAHLPKMRDLLEAIQKKILNRKRCEVSADGI